MCGLLLGTFARLLTAADRRHRVRVRQREAEGGIEGGRQGKKSSEAKERRQERKKEGCCCCSLTRSFAHSLTRSFGAPRMKRAPRNMGCRLQSSQFVAVVAAPPLPLLTFTHSLTHKLTHFFTHSLTHSRVRNRRKKQKRQREREKERGKCFLRALLLRLASLFVSF